MRLTWSVGLLVAAVAIAPVLAQKPNVVGRYEPLTLESPHPYPAVTGVTIGQEVFFPGATYVRVHFSKFQLADGDWLEISNMARTELYRYEGKGPHGTGEFWANTIMGESALITLYAPKGGGFGFAVDGAGRGIVPLDGSGPQPESVCGTQDWKDAKCYETSRPTEYARGRGSVLALIGCCSSCTAFKVSDGGQFMTNNHCTSSTSGVQSTELRFEYQLPGCASGSASYTASVIGSQMLKTDATLDYTLFTTTGSSSSIPCLELDARLPPVGERLYIAGHPNGGPKKLSVESDQNAGGLCAVDRSPYAGNGADTDVGYYCDTIGGSSGSPVLSGSSNKVVALHHFGGCLNSGVRIDRIYPQISSLLGSCNGGGGGPVCGNGSCEATESKCTCSADCGLPPTTEAGLCSNAFDDDCDNATDCTDSNCAGDPACPSCKANGQSCTFNRDCCSRRCSGALGRKTCR